MNWFKSCLLQNMSTAILSASPAAAAAARHRNTADSKPTIDQEEEISKTAASVAVAINTAGNNSNNGGECLVCGDGGELICCDTFDRVYHGKCLPGDDHGTLPGRWRCPICDSESCESKKMPAKNPVKSQHEQAHGENKNASDGGTPRKKRKCDKNSDDHCYICCYGGLLVCCDHCDKSFHMNCHVPPLQSIPEGEWKCCECAAASFSKRYKCGLCEACLREDCGKCIRCLDKLKFGGTNKGKQVCFHKQCPFLRYALPATVTPDAKKKMSHSKNDDNIKPDGALSASAGQTVVRHTTDKRKYQPSGEEASNNAKDATNSRRSKRAPKPSLKAKDMAAAAKRKANKSHTRKSATDSCARGSSSKPASSIEVSSTTTAAAAGQTMLAHRTTADTERSCARGSCKPAASVEIPAAVGDGMDAYSLATVPFPNGDSDVNDDIDDDDDNDTQYDLWMCQMELKRAQAENKRQADEIKRLKSAIQALTISLTG